MERSRLGTAVQSGVLALALLGVLALAGVAVASGPATADLDGGVSGGDAELASDQQTVGGEQTAVSHQTTQERSATELTQAVDADRTHVDVSLQSDGDADWTFEFRVRLEDDDARQAFESLQDDVAEDPESYAEDFGARMERTAETASSATGREMAVQDVTVDTRVDEIPQAYGVLVYELHWTGFAAVEDETLHAGDAIDGFPMDEETRLTVRWPEDYHAQSVTPAADDETEHRVTWRGSETEFVTGEPRVVVAPADDRSWLLPAVGIAALLLAVAVLVAWLVRRGTVVLPGRSQPAGKSGRVDGDASESATSNETAAAGPPSADGRATTDEQAGTDESAADQPAAADTAQRSDEEAATDDVPPELLSNEEQVLRVLEEQGGRAKQQQVVAELDWTEAKTSQVVTSMHDEGQIEKFRIGRENVLALPGEADL